MSKKNVFNWKRIVSVQNEFFEHSFVNEPLKDILTKLTNRLDELDPDHAVTVLIMTDEGLIPTAGSRIPKEWVELITPLPLGENIGSCGTAGFLKKRVIVENVLEDPLWANFREYQPEHGFMACWSEPVLDLSGELLGTFAVYFKEIRSPSRDELDLIEMLSNTVSVILQRKQMEQQLKERTDQLQIEIEVRKRAETKKTQLIKELQTSLGEIKTLRGILPICSFCKNIRTDEGYYEQIESYIHKHSGVDFSHTICPVCMIKHYPEEDYDSMAII